MCLNTFFCDNTHFLWLAPPVRNLPDCHSEYVAFRFAFTHCAVHITDLESILVPVDVDDS